MCVPVSVTIWRPPKRVSLEQHGQQMGTLVGMCLKPQPDMNTPHWYTELQARVGHVGPDAHLGGPLRRGQHLLQPEARLHLQHQPAPRPPPGHPRPHGLRHDEVGTPLPIGPLRLLLW